MLTYRGFSAWVISEGKELREFDAVADPVTNKVTCWIPCEIGKTFSVHWLDRGSKVDSVAYIKLDGFTAPGYFLFGSGTTERNSVRVGDRSERPFTFQYVAPNSGQGDLTEHNQEMGTIALKIRQIRRLSLEYAANAPLVPPELSHTRPGGSEACVDFGPARPTFLQHNKTWTFVPYDKSHPGNFVEFVFKYRTKEFLLEQGIISETSSMQPKHEFMCSKKLNSTSRVYTQTPAQATSNTMVHPPLPQLTVTPPHPPNPTIDPSIFVGPSFQHTTFQSYSYTESQTYYTQNTFISPRSAEALPQPSRLPTMPPQTSAGEAPTFTSSFPTPSSAYHRGYLNFLP
ncbi:hypothetical protein BDY19DRAFT_269274 [Irpex rosettiformis]|uniref:Uncharacterized protein n=1 Tax=Irpex rosettiformis TaxID=378272 RepID=A0ACB8UH89_9APHY|nr:hypothetical protein BDY19DRAFT_269274 [Irpex rosettiformis]